VSGHVYDTHQDFDFLIFDFRDCLKVGDNMKSQDIKDEIKRLKAQFTEVDDALLEVLDALIQQAAHETIYLRQLNAQAEETGLVKCHPSDPTVQKVLPVSQEITRHSAALTNIIDKLCKHLNTDIEDDDGLDEYE